MNNNFEKARYLMVENQLRPNKIKDPVILNLFKNIKKEDFLSSDIKEISYSDLEIQLEKNRGYLTNLHLAQLIHNANIKKHHKVLHIGGMTGYVSVLLSKLCKELIVIENNNEFIYKLEENINNLKIQNIKIINSSFKEGHNLDSPYNIVFIDNPIKEISNTIKNQLSNEYGKIIMIKKINFCFCKAFKITNNNNNFAKKFLFDVFTKYELYNDQNEFVF